MVMVSHQTEEAGLLKYVASIAVAFALAGGQAFAGQNDVKIGFGEHCNWSSFWTSWCIFWNKSSIGNCSWCGIDIILCCNKIVLFILTL